jgi:hypothetical protein
MAASTLFITSRSSTVGNYLRMWWANWGSESAAVAFVIVGVVVITLALRGTLERSQERHKHYGDDVLRVAYAIPDGGGYAMGGTGVPQDVFCNGNLVLPRSQGGSYCCGFTFAVAMRVAADRRLLDHLSVEQLKQFQKKWYGATSDSRMKQLVTAMEDFGIGIEVNPVNAVPGDFVVFSTKTYGHSAVFLDWVRRNGVIVGLKYRSSQVATDGVGDDIQYFTSSNYSDGTIFPQYLFIGRLLSK